MSLKKHPPEGGSMTDTELVLQAHDRLPRSPMISPIDEAKRLIAQDCLQGLCLALQGLRPSEVREILEVFIPEQIDELAKLDFPTYAKYVCQACGYKYIYRHDADITGITVCAKCGNGVGPEKGVFPFSDYSKEALLV